MKNLNTGHFGLTFYSGWLLHFVLDLYIRSYVMKVLSLFDGISNSQRYKCLGNGWECNTITHIFKDLKNA